MMRSSLAGAIALAALVAGCGPRIGTIATRDAAGRVTTELETRDGRPHGHFVRYDARGQIVERGQYADGFRTGVFETLAGAAVVGRVLYRRGQILWTGRGPDEQPPAALIARVEAERRGGSFYPAVANPDDAPRASALLPAGDRVGQPDGAVAQLGLRSPAPETWVQRVDLFAQWTFRRVAFYGETSGATMAVGGERELGRWILGAGGAARLHLPAGHGLIVRAGLVVPVAGDDALGYGVRAASSMARPGDAATDAPRAVVARTSVSGHGGDPAGLAYRVDFGVDLALGILGERADLRVHEKLGAFVRLGGGVARRFGPLAASLEAVAVRALVDAPAADRLTTTLSAAVHAPAWSGAFVALTAPVSLDEPARWMASAGLQVAIGGVR